LNFQHWGGETKQYVFQSMLDYVGFLEKKFREDPDWCFVNFQRGMDVKDWMKNAYYHAIGLDKERDEIVTERMESRGRPNTVTARGVDAVAVIVEKEMIRQGDIKCKKEKE